jgi:hypothetical protein
VGRQDNAHASASDLRGARDPVSEPLSAAEVRELWAFVHGDIMIGGIRQHLRRAMGLCPRHTWGYALAEIELWVHGAGVRGGHQPFDVCVLYEDLLEHVAAALRAHHAPWRHDLRPLITATDSCRICDALKTTGVKSGLPGLGGLDRHSLATEANATTWTAAWCRETQSVWRPRICPVCLVRSARVPVPTGYPSPDQPPESTEFCCRLHLAELPLNPATGCRVGARLDEVRARTRRLLTSMTQLGAAATPDENASWIEALGWFAGWDVPLGLTST